MGSARTTQRRKHNTFFSLSSSLLPSPRPFASISSQPSPLLSPTDLPASPEHPKGFGHSIERMTIHRPEPEVTAENEAEHVAPVETTNPSPFQLASDTEALAEQDQPMQTARGTAPLATSSASALQFVSVSAGDPVPLPPPVNRQVAPKRSGWSLESIAITRDHLSPVQRKVASRTPEPASQPEVLQQQPVESVTTKENTTGLPDHLKSGIESLSGLSLDDVHVHYNSSKPAEVNALAYTQGSEIHVGLGQEKHLAHEAWHVVQQKQGRVEPTLQAKGVAINDDVELEREADVMGERAGRDRPSVDAPVAMAISTLPSTVQRQGKKPPQQGSDDINILYKNAGPAFEELKQFTRQFAEKTGGTPVIPDDLKKREKAMKKVESVQYGGDASRLLDIARTTITYDTLAQVDAARAQIESSLQQFAPDAHIVRVKDRFANPTESGYRDYLANIQMSNGHIVELQLHLAPIEAVKADEHKLYDIVQDIKENASRQGRPLTAEEQGRIDELNKQSQEIYRKALEGKSGQ
jgi:hypothetical protein